MEKEGKEYQENITMRIHHLHIWGDVVKKYLEYSHDIKPWEVSPENFSETANFVRQLTKDDMDTDLIAKKYFDESILEDPDAPDRYRYVIDLIGNDDDTHQKVLERRTHLFMDIFAKASQSKHIRIFLTDEPDDYCRTCAIGNHCNIVSPDDDNNDICFKNALDAIFRDERMRVLIQKGNLGFTEKGVMFITADTLFNPNFHLLLEWNVKHQSE